MVEIRPTGNPLYMEPDNTRFIAYDPVDKYSVTFAKDDSSISYAPVDFLIFFTTSFNFIYLFLKCSLI
jgi:hypothetical protein